MYNITKNCLRRILINLAIPLFFLKLILNSSYILADQNSINIIVKNEFKNLQDELIQKAPFFKKLFEIEEFKDFTKFANEALDTQNEKINSTTLSEKDVSSIRNAIQEFVVLIYEDVGIKTITEFRKPELYDIFDKVRTNIKRLNFENQELNTRKNELLDKKIPNLLNLSISEIGLHHFSVLPATYPTEIDPIFKQEIRNFGIGLAKTIFPNIKQEKAEELITLCYDELDNPTIKDFYNYFERRLKITQAISTTTSVATGNNDGLNDEIHESITSIEGNENKREFLELIDKKIQETPEEVQGIINDVNTATKETSDDIKSLISILENNDSNIFNLSNQALDNSDSALAASRDNSEQQYGIRGSLFKGGGELLNSEQNNDKKDCKTSVFGGALGVDYKINRHALVGFFAGAQSSELINKKLSANGDIKFIKSFFAAIYGNLKLHKKLSIDAKIALSNSMITDKNTNSNSNRVWGGLAEIRGKYNIRISSNFNLIPIIGMKFSKNSDLEINNGTVKNLIQTDLHKTLFFGANLNIKTFNISGFSVSPILHYTYNYALDSSAPKHIISIPNVKSGAISWTKKTNAKNIIVNNSNVGFSIMAKNDNTQFTFGFEKTSSEVYNGWLGKIKIRYSL